MTNFVGESTLAPTTNDNLGDIVLPFISTDVMTPISVVNMIHTAIASSSCITLFMSPGASSYPVVPLAVLTAPLITLCNPNYIHTWVFPNFILP